MMNTLPQDFLVGAATAAHQVEGNNIHSDYWAMEHMKYGNFNEPSLAAVDHYNRYEEDIKMVAEYMVKIKINPQKIVITVETAQILHRNKI